MRKIWLTLFYFVLLLHTASGQTPSLEKKLTLGGSSSEQSPHIEHTKDGGYIIGGTSSSNDGDVDSTKGSDAWVIKLDKNLKTVWKKSFGSPGNEALNAIHQTSDGGYIMAGYTDGSTVNGYQGSTDFWVAKITKDGILQWQRALGGTAIDIANSVRQTSDGGYVVAGVAASNDGDLSFVGTDDDLWIVKLNSSGNTIEWQKVMYSSLGQGASDIQQTPDGGYIIAGYSAASGYDVPLNLGGFDCWVIKLDSDRNVQWNKIYGGSLNELARSVELTNDGGYIIAANTRSNDADVTGNHGSNDYWILKLRNNGSIQWQKTLGGTGYELASFAKQTSDSGYIVAGYTESTGGQVSGNHGSGDYWLVKLTQTGSLQWQKTIGGSLNDQAFSVDTTNDNEYIIAGQVFSNDGDVSDNHGETDFFVAKTTSNLISVYNKKNAASKEVLLVKARSSTVDINGSPIVIKVTADNSSSTIITYTGITPLTKAIRILSHPEANTGYSPEYGQMIESKRTGDTLQYTYHHPQYVVNGDASKFVEYDFQIIDTITTANIVSGKLRIYHVPVLMIHGVWSSVRAFEKMEKYLVNNANNYEPFQIQRQWYDSADHGEPRRSAFFYKDVISKAVQQLIDKSLLNKISCAKINVIGHSRGGLFARYYLQENYRPYNDDINSLVTINSPHSGAQTANQVLDKRSVIFLKIGDLVSKKALQNEDPISHKKYTDDINGAYELRVNDTAITQALNGNAHLNKHMVPTHAIVSTFKFGISNAELNELKILPGIVRFGLRLVIFLLGAKCDGTNADDCIQNEIFDGDENDFIVPISSQKGGLPPNAITQLSSFSHSSSPLTSSYNMPGVTDATATHLRIAQLLRQNPYSNSSNFTMGGFHPTDLSNRYNFLSNISGDPFDYAKIAATDSITILKTLAGSFYKPGDTVLVPIASSASVQKVLISYDGQSLPEILSDVNTGNAVFKLPLPKAVIGKINIVAYGFNNTGLIAIDSSFINVNVPVGISLDSIKIVSTNDSIISYSGDSSLVNVIGYYSDTVRTISGLAGLTYNFKTGGVASMVNTNFLKGLIPGYSDTLTVGFSGKTDFVAVAVNARDLPIDDYLSTTVTTIANGNWSDTATWSNHKIPDRYSIIVLNKEVIVDIDAECKSLLNRIGGKLIVNPGKNINIGASPEN